MALFHIGSFNPYFTETLSLYVWFAHKVYNFFQVFTAFVDYTCIIVFFCVSTPCGAWYIPTLRRNILAAFGQILPHFSQLIDAAISSQTLQNLPEPDFVTLRTKADHKISQQLLLI